MPEPTWARVLRVMYEEDLEGEAGGRKLVDSYQKAVEDFAKNLDEDPAKLRRTMGYMDSIGLIDGWSEEEATQGDFNLGDNVTLTEKGFEVAHERELAKRQDRTNTALVVLTFGLVLATVVTNIPFLVVQILGGLIVLILLGGILYYTDFLEPSSL